MNIKQVTKQSESESDADSGSDHELFYYTGNRFKLMQQVLKLIQPKMLQSMAPQCMKGLPLSVIKTMLLDELLGISNKRLRYMLDGVNMEVESSSESEQDLKPDIDIISLDDISDNSQICISDDDNCMQIQLSRQERLELETETSESNSKSRVRNNKTTLSKMSSNKIKKKPKPKDPVMNVLNLLELQARARAIRSQLAVEVCKVEDPVVPLILAQGGSGDESSSESVIIINPEKTLIVIPDSDEETINGEEQNKTECTTAGAVCAADITETTVNANEIIIDIGPLVENGHETPENVNNTSETMAEAASNTTEQTIEIEVATGEEAAITESATEKPATIEIVAAL